MQNRAGGLTDINSVKPAAKKNSPPGIGVTIDIAPRINSSIASRVQSRRFMSSAGLSVGLSGAGSHNATDLCNCVNAVVGHLWHSASADRVVCLRFYNKGGGL